MSLEQLPFKYIACYLFATEHLSLQIYAIILCS
jgi:hypothetical protein